ncbi:hypothetical protein FMO003_25780 [Moritella sp. F3]|nr:hypothetical protein FMO001_19050 [Moritella sp. F1]GIC82297.1 hypothetical protein FMO003_25780 [Moritella sp. F3]
MIGNWFWRRLEKGSPTDAVIYISMRLFIVAAVLIGFSIYYFIPNSNVLVSLGIACSCFCLMTSALSWFLRND